MTRVTINVDAGEGEPESELDIAFLQYVDAINIALGGHAGHADWSRELASRAIALGCEVHLHPSYPDRDGFGRQVLDMAWSDLANSLSQQRAVLPGITICKFHGVLYNEAARDSQLAKRLTRWCKAEGITKLLAPPNSRLHEAAGREGILILREAFADRRYEFSDHTLSLAARSTKGSVIDSIDEAIDQTRQIIEQSTVTTLDGTRHSLTCDTICIHGDSPISLGLAERLRCWLNEREATK